MISAQHVLLTDWYFIINNVQLSIRCDGKFVRKTDHRHMSAVQETFTCFNWLEVDNYLNTCILLIFNVKYVNIGVNLYYFLMSSFSIYVFV